MTHILKNLIKNNLSTISVNLRAGLAGLALYPTLHVLTPVPTGPYAFVCYSVHHLHILSSLQRISILTNRIEKIPFEKKYINYNPVTGNFSFDEKIKSLYFTKVAHVNVINENKNNFWYTKVIKQSTFTPDCQIAINEIVNCRDILVRTIIGMNMVMIITSCTILPYFNVLDAIIYMNIINPFYMYLLSRTDFKNRVDHIKKEIDSNKKYFYVNTFGDIVPTDYKYGLYIRYKIKDF